VGNQLPPLALPEIRKAVELFHSTEPERAATWFEAKLEPDQKRAAQADAAAHKLVRDALMKDRENNPRLADMVMLRAIKRMIAANIPVVSGRLGIKVERVHPGYYKIERADGRFFTIQRGVPRTVETWEIWSTESGYFFYANTYADAKEILIKGREGVASAHGPQKV
jgi:hypothetical protein